MTKSPLPPAWEVPPVLRARLGEKLGRQRAMFAEGHLLLILHAPPKADENERVARAYWRKPEGSWLSTESSGGANTLAKHLEEFARRLEQIDRAVDSATSARDYFAVISQLAPLVRTVRNQHKTLQEAREVVSDPEMITLRDRTYELERFAELLYEDAKNGLDFAVAKRAEEQSSASHRMEVAAHRLNLLVAFFFPLATIAAVLGVNLKHGWEENPETTPWLFWGFVGVGTLLGLLLTGFMYVNMPRYEKPPKDPYEKRL